PDLRDDLARVPDPPGGARVLDQRAEVFALGGAVDGEVDLAQLDAQPVGAPLQHLLGGGEDVGGDEEDVAVALHGAAGEQHRLGRGGGLVEGGGVGDVHPGEVAGHRLGGQQRREAALGDLGRAGGGRR